MHRKVIVSFMLLVLFFASAFPKSISSLGSTRAYNTAGYGSPPPTEWTRTYGGTSNDILYSVVQTDDGGYAMAGETYSYGAGGYDSWLVKVAPELHDVAIANITLSQTRVLQGRSVSINVTSENQGNYTETFNVTVCANTTSIASQHITLTSGNSTNIIFTWNTTSFVKGNYTIWAYASPITGETDTLDNTKTADSQAKVGVPGDLNGDNLCDLLDLVKVAGRFGKLQGEPGYDPNYDINDDNIIDLLDLVKVAIHFGETDP